MFGRAATLDSIINRPKPTAWSEFCAQPVIFLARKIYTYHRSRRPTDEPKHRSLVTVVCISDTHNCCPSLPDGDMLIHAGDLTQSGSVAELQATVDWLNGQPHRHKIVIAGNHDRGLSGPSRSDIRWGNVTYLQNSSVTVRCSQERELKIYGSPLSPQHGNWAFQYPRTTNMWGHTIPSDTDILITHAPPYGHLDVNRYGCWFLLEELWRLKRRPVLHVFGHAHEGYGVENATFDSAQRAYDNVMMSKGGFWPLLQLGYYFLRSFFRADSTPFTWLVNAAMVGGLRDEMRRVPISITI